MARELLTKYPNEFKPGDFQHNKRKVAEITTVTSNVLRNRIAGYITRQLSGEREGEQPISG